MAQITFLLLVLCIGVTVSTVVDLQKRIYNGIPCGQNERLYHVSLSKRQDGKPGHCGGSLISKQWILTAAHCNENQMYASVGVHPVPGRPEEIETKVPHPTDDIMLLKLRNPINNITPVQLPVCQMENNIYADEPKINDEVQVAGHGYYLANQNRVPITVQPAVLLCANLHVVDCGPTRNDPCYFKSTTYPDVPYKNRMCYKESNQDTCAGDSGGGVIYNNNIYGVHIGNGACVCTRPAVSLKVCSYIQWIHVTMTQYQ